MLGIDIYGFLLFLQFEYSLSLCKIGTVRSTVSRACVILWGHVGPGLLFCICQEKNKENRKSRPWVNISTTWRGGGGGGDVAEMSSLGLQIDYMAIYLKGSACNLSDDLRDMQ